MSTNSAVSRARADERRAREIYEQGHSVSATARILGVPKSTALGRIRRAGTPMRPSHYNTPPPPPRPEGLVPGSGRMGETKALLSVRRPLATFRISRSTLAAIDAACGGPAHRSSWILAAIDAKLEQDLGAGAA